jgi:hypothetical protein
MWGRREGLMILLGKPKEKRLLERFRHKWEIILN